MGHRMGCHGMSTPKNPQELAAAIEALVADYIAESRRTAQLALDRALLVAATHPTPTSKPPSKPSKPRGPYRKRRSSEEISALADRLCQLIHIRPGESKVTLAAELGVTVRDLERPTALLKREGRLRVLGQRHAARYYPALASSAVTHTR